MRTILLIIVIIVLAFVGYTYVYKGEPVPQDAAQARQQVDSAAKAAGAAATDATQKAGAAIQEGADKLKEGSPNGTKPAQ